VVRRSRLGAALGGDRMFFNLEQAVEVYEALPGSRESRSRQAV